MVSAGDFFSVSSISKLSEVTPSSAIHVIGVCGVAMAPLAVHLASLGFKVSGSDREYYEPMASVLRRSTVVLQTGYDSSHIPEDTRLVVIGNAARRDNVEVCAVEKRRIPYTIFPALAADVLMTGKHGLVVAGTHGKSTTAALAAFTLRSLNSDPSYFVGGEVGGLGDSLHVGAGQYAVIEGDEYFSAFFAHVPKFKFYPANTLIITSLEFDHADIYTNLAEIEEVFKEKVLSLPGDATAFVFIDSPFMHDLALRWERSCRARLITYGVSDKAQLRVVGRSSDGETQRVEVAVPDGSRHSFSIQLSGVHNALNATAVFGSLLMAGFEPDQIAAGMASFGGVRRRQEVRYRDNCTILIEDFAHHPTAVKLTLAGLKERFPDYSLTAVFEPRSNSSRRKIFQDQYAGAFGAADTLYLSRVAAREGDDVLVLLDVDLLGASLREAGVETLIVESADEAYLRLQAEIAGWHKNSTSSPSKNLIVVMSNGSFGGLTQRLQDALQAVTTRQKLPAPSGG